MRNVYIVIVTGVLFFALISPHVSAAQDRPGGKPAGRIADSGVKGKDGNKISITSKAPVYRPPLRGAPRRRVGGGVRGVVGGAQVELFVLAPDHTGWTIHPQSDLYWYFATPTMSKEEYSMRLDITFNDEEVIKPILELSLAPPEKHGVQRIRLSDYGIQLKPGATYEWFVALVRDPDNRSLDIVAGAAIKRVDPSQALLERLAKATEREKPSIYAQEGLWYDALSSISDLIDAHPDEKDVREQRALLLEQVGLSKAAAHDR